MSLVEPASVHKVISCCEWRGLVFQPARSVGAGTHRDNGVRVPQYSSL